MFGWMGSLFTTADGQVPFFQIILGLIIGAVMMLIYAKFFRPPFIVGDDYIFEPILPMVPPTLPDPTIAESHVDPADQVDLDAPDDFEDPDVDSEDEEANAHVVEPM
jgi:hypothetical protein